MSTVYRTQEYGFPVRVVPLVLGLSAAGVLLWWAGTPRPPPAVPSPPGGSLVERPDSLILDREGQPVYRLRGERLVRPQVGEGVRVARPWLEFYREHGPPWRLSASNAWMNEADRIIVLEGSVELWSIHSGLRACITTESATVWPDKKYVESDRTTRMQGIGFDVRSAGMRGWLDEWRIELVEGVRGWVLPEAAARELADSPGGVVAGWPPDDESSCRGAFYGQGATD